MSQCGGRVCALLLVSSTINVGAQLSDAQGTYRWRGKDAQGLESVFEFRPSQIAPLVRSRITRENREFVYSFDISNEKTAKDAIVGCFIAVVHPVAAGHPPPDGWAQMGPRNSIPRVGWFVRDSSIGVVPGASRNGFEFRSTNWPGPSSIKCNGLSTVIEEPQWLSPRARRELKALQERELVEVRTLGPAILVESDMPPALLYASVVRSYRESVASGTFANKGRLVATLDALRTAGAGQRSSGDMESLLGSVRAAMITSEAPDRATRELFVGLGLCLENLLELERARVQ